MRLYVIYAETLEHSSVFIEIALRAFAKIAETILRKIDRKFLTSSSANIQLCLTYLSSKSCHLPIQSFYTISYNLI